MILAFSLLILSSRVLPSWLGWFGILAGVAALASIVFFTMVIWLLWIAVTSVLLFVRNAGQRLGLSPDGHLGPADVQARGPACTGLSL